MPIVEFVRARPRDLDSWQIGLLEKEPLRHKRKEFVEVEDESKKESIEAVDRGTSYALN